MQNSETYNGEGPYKIYVVMWFYDAMDMVAEADVAQPSSTSLVGYKSLLPSEGDETTLAGGSWYQHVPGLL